MTSSALIRLIACSAHQQFKTLITYSSNPIYSILYLQNANTTITLPNSPRLSNFLLSPTTLCAGRVPLPSSSLFIPNNPPRRDHQLLGLNNSFLHSRPKTASCTTFYRQCPVIIILLTTHFLQAREGKGKGVLGLSEKQTCE